MLCILIELTLKDLNRRIMLYIKEPLYLLTRAFVSVCLDDSLPVPSLYTSYQLIIKHTNASCFRYQLYLTEAMH